MPSRHWFVVLAPTVFALSCSSLLDYGSVTFGEPNAEPGDSGPGGSGAKGGAGGSGASGKGGGGGTSKGGSGTGGGAGTIGMGGTSGGGGGSSGTGGGSGGTGGGTGGTGGTGGGSAGTGGGTPATCNNSVCESGEDCSNCPADCVCGTDTACVFASPPGQWTCICTGNGFCAPGLCKSDRCNCTQSDGGVVVCDPGKACAGAGCAP